MGSLETFSQQKIPNAVRMVLIGEIFRGFEMKSMPALEGLTVSHLLD